MVVPIPPHRVELVPITYIAPNPWQPRQHVRDEDLADLVESIKCFGFSLHLEVRHDPADLAAKL